MRDPKRINIPPPPERLYEKQPPNQRGWNKNWIGYMCKREQQCCAQGRSMTISEQFFEYQVEERVEDELLLKRPDPIAERVQVDGPCPEEASQRPRPRAQDYESSRYQQGDRHGHHRPPEPCLPQTQFAQAIPIYYRKSKYRQHPNKREHLLRWTRAPKRGFDQQKCDHYLSPEKKSMTIDFNVPGTRTHGWPDSHTSSA